MLMYKNVKLDTFWEVVVFWRSEQEYSGFWRLNQDLLIIHDSDRNRKN